MAYRREGDKKSRAGGRKKKAIGEEATQCAAVEEEEARISPRGAH